MISFEKKFIFIHISKTGGSSIERSLMEYSHFDVKFQNNGNALLKDKHWSIYTYSNRIVDLDDGRLGKIFNLDEYFKFSFVRNPWDRIVSNFFYLTSIDRNKAESNLAYHSVKDWIFKTPKERTADNQLGLWCDNYRCSKSGGPISSQYSKISMNDQLVMDFIGRYETLQDDFDIVCEKISIAKRQLPWNNKSKHENYKEYYDREAKEKVAEQFAVDIVNFGYAF